MAAVQFMIGGEVVACPDEVEKEGDAAVAAWYAAQDAPHAEAALKKSGLKASDVIRTGHAGAMLTGDVERAIIARDAAKAAAKAPDAPSAPAAADTPKEG